MDKAQKNIQTGLNQLDDVMGKRTRAIQRKLKSVEALSEVETRSVFPEINEKNEPVDDDEDEEA
jgi:DNA recombination protein RmuC